VHDSGFCVFRGYVSMARFPMFNGFFQMCDPFAHMWMILASIQGMLQRGFRMFQECLSMTLFAMVHRFLRVHDGFPDVTGGGRLGVQHGHTNEHSKRNQNEGTTVEFADHLCFPSMIRIHCRKRL
jgi:hypothetical protein